MVMNIWHVGDTPLPHNLTLVEMTASLLDMARICKHETRFDLCPVGFIISEGHNCIHVVHCADQGEAVDTILAARELAKQYATLT